MYKNHDYVGLKPKFFLFILVKVLCDMYYINYIEGIGPFLLNRDDDCNSY